MSFFKGVAVGSSLGALVRRRCQITRRRAEILCSPFSLSPHNPSIFCCFCCHGAFVSCTRDQGPLRHLHQYVARPWSHHRTHYSGWIHKPHFNCFSKAEYVAYISSRIGTCFATYAKTRPLRSRRSTKNKHTQTVLLLLLSLLTKRAC